MYDSIFKIVIFGDAGCGKTTLNKRFIKDSFFHINTSNQKRLTREMALQVGNYFNDETILKYATSDIFWDKVIEITIENEQDVYDITIDKIHNFITAQGLCAHNTVEIEYDCDLIWLMHQDFHVKRDTKWVWEYTTEYNEIEIMPYNELIYAKNKEGSFKGTVYYKFNTLMSKFEEATFQDLEANGILSTNKITKHNLSTDELNLIKHETPDWNKTNWWE